jgi:uncharacterized protein (TIGR03437 family)
LWDDPIMPSTLLAATILAIATATQIAAATYDLSSGWSNATNPNGPWTYNEGTIVLPLISNWNAGNTTWSASCGQPAWAPSNVSKRFLPVWLQANACTAPYFPVDSNNSASGNVLTGDIVLHTNDDGNGNLLLGMANVVFTAPVAGSYAITGVLWDARFDPAEPQDWTLLLNGGEIASGILPGGLPRSLGQRFSVTQNLIVGDRVELDVFKDASSQAGNFVGVQLTLTSLSAIPTVNGVVSASAFGEFASASPGSWIEIYGSNLASETRGWTTDDFTGINAPISLSGTSVTIGGQDAFVDYISPGQVNALIPSNVATGPQQLTLKTAAGTSAPFNLTVNAVEPGLLAPPSFKVNDVQYAVAFFGDGTYVLPTGAISGLNSRPAKPGDEIVLYGVGFGLVTPDIPAGQLVQQSNTLASGFQISVGGIAAQPAYDGLAPSYTGLYQFNLTVPNVASGNQPLTFTVDGVAGTQTLYVAVQN